MKTKIADCAEKEDLRAGWTLVACSGRRLLVAMAASAFLGKFRMHRAEGEQFSGTDFWVENA